METKNGVIVEEDNIVELEDDNGNIIKLEHVLTYEHAGKVYIAFVPVGDDANAQNDEEEEVILMHLKEDDNGDELFLPIQEEEELENAWEAFLNIYYEETKDMEDEEEDEEQ